MHSNSKPARSLLFDSLGHLEPRINAMGSHIAYKHAPESPQGSICNYRDAMGSPSDSKAALSLLLDSLGHL
jgi:hypothetical protein